MGSLSLPSGRIIKEKGDASTQMRIMKKRKGGLKRKNSVTDSTAGERDGELFFSLTITKKEPDCSYLGKAEEEEKRAEAKASADMLPGSCLSAG